MHPNSTFRWEDRAAMRALVSELGFGQLFAATPDGPRVAHVPVVWLDDDTLGLHVARGNGIARHLDGATGAVHRCSAPTAISAPTGTGSARSGADVELCRGRARGHDAADGATTRWSRRSTSCPPSRRRSSPKTPWTRDKMDPKLFDKMTTAIVGFRLEIAAWRGTLKLGQNKPEAARLAAADGAEARAGAASRTGCAALA